MQGALEVNIFCDPYNLVRLVIRGGRVGIAHPTVESTIAIGLRPRVVK